MKVLFMWALLVSNLSACFGSPALTGPNCEERICIKLLVAEPVRFNEPVKITISVQTQKDVNRVGVSLDFTNSDAVVIEGAKAWYIDTKAGQSTTVTSILRFTREGYIGVIARVGNIPQVPGIQDVITVHVTRDGGTVYPAGTTIPITPVQITPSNIILPSQGTPLPTPTRASFPATPTR